MNPIDALKMAFPSPANHIMKTSGSKTDGASAEPGAFSQLLISTAAEVKEPDTPQFTGIQAKLEEILKALEDLPIEDLTAEQQEMFSMIAQLLSIQTKELETALQGLGIVSEKSSGKKSQVQTPIVKALYEEKTTVLLQQIQQKLEQLSPGNLTKFDAPLEITSAENPAFDLEQIEQVAKQLIRDFENTGAVNGKPAASPQSEKLEQVLIQLVQLTQNLESPAPLTETPKSNTAQIDAARIAQTVTAFQPEEIAGLEVEGGQTAEPVPTAPAEGAKSQAVQPALRTEAAAPVVRMANLIEDLGEVLRGSMRLNGTGENAQIKVSIFPEHLGHLEIRLATVDGKITAQIFTSSLAAKEAIEMQLNQLRQTMLQQGIDIERLEITQQSPQQSFGQHSANAEQRFSQHQKQGTAAANKNGYLRIEEEMAATNSQAPDGSMMKVDYTI